MSAIGTKRTKVDFGRDGLSATRSGHHPALNDLCLNLRPPFQWCGDEKTSFSCYLEETRDRESDSPMGFRANAIVHAGS